MSLFVKVCGITDMRAANAAVEAGADAVGFVLTASPRQVASATARAISEALPREVLRVAVFRTTNTEEARSALGEFSPDVIQADHRSQVSIEGVGFLPVYRDGSGDQPTTPWFLFEGVESGIGRMVDLERAAAAARLGHMIIAGGLRTENVDSVVTRVRPYGVDVSSGVETSPGVKDPLLISQFVISAKKAGERMMAV